MKIGPLRSFQNVLPAQSSERRLAIVYAAFALVIFFTALVVTFPHETLVRMGIRNATAESSVTIDFSELHFRPPFGYQVSDLHIVSDSRQPFSLRVSDLKATPSLLSLIIPGQRNAVDLTLSIWGGLLEGRLAGDPANFAITARGEGLDIASATQGALPPPGQIYGKARLDLDVEGTEDGRQLEGNLILAVQNLALRDLTAGGFKVPDLTFDTLEMAVEARGNSLKIRKFVVQGSDVSIRATGKITRNRFWKRSSLDLRFELIISPDAPAGLRILPRLLPKRKDGEQFYNLRGTLAKPRIS